jgi:hypothetical protein
MRSFNSVTSEVLQRLRGSPRHWLLSDRVCQKERDIPWGLPMNDRARRLAAPQLSDCEEFRPPSWHGDPSAALVRIVKGAHALADLRISAAPFATLLKFALLSPSIPGETYQGAQECLALACPVPVLDESDFGNQ